MPKLIGLSLSHCVNDIAAGLVREGDVQQIVARTEYRNPEAWSQGLLSYQKGAWKGNAIATEIALRLLQEGKIDQPRLTGKEVPHLTADDSHWIDAQTRQPVVLSSEQQEKSASLEGARSRYEQPLMDAFGHGPVPEISPQLTAKITDILKHSATQQVT